MKRIFYTAFNITSPAGESTTITACSRRAESFNFPGTKRSGTTGFDFLTNGLPTTLTVEGVSAEQLGSNNLPAPQSAPTPYHHYYFEISP